MKYLFIIATLLATPLISMNAQSLRDLWIQMPFRHEHANGDG